MSERIIHSTTEVIFQKQVCKMLGISETTLWRWQKSGKAPKHITLPSGRKAWRVSGVREWLESLGGEA